MKKIKYLLLIITSLFIFTQNIKAEGKVEITNANLIDKSENAIANIENFQGLIFNTKETFSTVGEYVKYKITLKNNTSEELKVSNIKDNLNSDYIETIYEFEKETISVNGEYSFNLTLKYKKEITNDSEKLKLPLEILIEYDNGQKTTILVNPKTSDNILFYLGLFIVSAIVLKIFKKNKKKILPVLLAFILIPSITKALNNELVVNANNDIEIYKEKIQIDNTQTPETPNDQPRLLRRSFVNQKATITKTGKEINKILKTLAGTEITGEAAETDDENIKHIVRAQALPTDIELTDDNIISDDNSLEPIYAWFDNGTIYYYSNSEKIYLNDDCWYLFGRMKNLESVDLSSFDTSKVTTMRSMFYECNNLKELDLTNFDTSNVTSMRTMFYNCNNLTKLDVSSFDTSNVTEMNHMFYKCMNLSKLDTSKFDTSNVTTMRSMFYECSGLTEINVKSFNTSNVEDMSYMFDRCSGLSDLDLSSFNTSNVTNMNFMFYMTNFKNLDFVKKFDTSKLTELKGTFGYMFELEDITALKDWNTSNVTDMSSLFVDSRSLVDLTGLEKWDTSNVTSFSFTFGLNPEPQGGRKKDNAIIDMTPLKDWNTSSATTMYCMFQNYNIKSFEPFAKWDVSKVENFSNTFNQTKWTTVTSLKGLENWDVSSAKVMSDMFFDGHALEDVSAIENWDVTNVETFSSMFSGSKIHPEFTKVTGTWKSGTFTRE